MSLSLQMNQYHLDLSVRVLTSGYWPTPSTPTKINLPLIAKQSFEVFRTFYLEKHCGRILTLQPSLGNVDLNAEFYTPINNSVAKVDVQVESDVSSSSLRHSKAVFKPRKHVLNVSTHQMCVLMLFNTREKITYEEMKTETDISDKDLIRALQSLSIGKQTQRILIKSPKSLEIGWFLKMIIQHSNYFIPLYRTDKRF